ncbi:MAG TPA: chaperone modulator CbpM [Chitinophagaceae bacterium]|nr:chaperone modulator CbpM [Chitinophagaceae bacterium]
MQKEHFIPVGEICSYNDIDISFVTMLYDNGLIELVTAEESYLIPEYELQKLEKMIRLYRDLEINVEGIDAIIHLLDRISKIQQEVSLLRNRLRLYEDLG